MQKPKVIFLAGPTAIGKTEIGACLAKRICAEIISCDSMQIYKGMDIITSKPPLELRRKIPHYLIDIVRPAQTYDVFRYYKETIGAIKKVVKKGKIPLFVGGSGLYMSTVIDGIFQGAREKDPKIRQELYQQAGVLGSRRLHEQLNKVDPQSCAKIHPNDTRRIVRALEVFKITGKPLSWWKTQRKPLTDNYAVKIFCLDMDRKQLYRQIDQRIERMFKQGLVLEVKKLLKQKLSKTAGYAIGIREIKGYLDGKYSLEEAKQLIKNNTHAYARRQLTWFRRDKRITWVNIGLDEKPEKITSRIIKKIIEMDN